MGIRVIARWLAFASAASGVACGGGSSAAVDAPGGGGGDAPSCSTGDDCNVSANTGCDDDDRCAVVQLASCFFPACETDGPEQLGDPCSMASNNEGAEMWDSCAPTLVCYQGTCTQACGHGGKACTGSAQCVQDPDLGGLVLDICM